MENSAEYQHSDDAVMGKWVYVEDGVVVDRTQIDPFNVFAPSYAELFMPAPPEVDSGWLYKDGQFLPPPGPSPEEIQRQNKQTADGLLAATDWVNQPDVTDPARSPHLTNQAEFLDYRAIVRAIAVNPPTTLVTDWPTLPTEVWA